MRGPIEAAITARRDSGSRALIPFITSGYPNKRQFNRLMNEFIGTGADIIEVGIPFSDPMADGKTIQFSSQKALENGVTIRSTLDNLSSLRDGRNVPIVLMSYLNPILSYGLKKFAKDASNCGVRGLIIPDLIPDEGAKIEQVCRKADIDLIYLLAPTSDDTRKRLILKRTHGFLYLVAIAGVTGARGSLPGNLSGWISSIKRESRYPVCVGFGISNGHQARTIGRYADGIIIGSAIIDIIRRSSANRAAIEVHNFIKRIRKELTNV